MLPFLRFPKVVHRLFTFCLQLEIVFDLPSNTIDKAWIIIPEIIIPVQWFRYCPLFMFLICVLAFPLRQTKLVSCLVNFWMHDKILIDWLIDWTNCKWMYGTSPPKWPVFSGCAFSAHSHKRFLGLCYSVKWLNLLEHDCLCWPRTFHYFFLLIADLSAKRARQEWTTWQLSAASSRGRNSTTTLSFTVSRSTPTLLCWSSPRESRFSRSVWSAEIELFTCCCWWLEQGIVRCTTVTRQAQVGNVSLFATFTSTVTKTKWNWRRHSCKIQIWCT